MTRKIVFIPIETKVREFDSRMLLAFSFLKNGCEVFIGSRAGVIREAQIFKGVSVIYKSYSQSLSGFFRRIKKDGGFVYILEEEGLVMYRDEVASMMSKVPINSLSEVDCYFFSGNRTFKIARSLHGDLGNFLCTGNARFDLISLKYRPYFENVIEGIREKYGRFILINTSFGSGNTFDGKEAQMNRIKRNKDYTLDFKELLKRKIRWDEENIKNYCLLVKKLASSYSALNFVVRPHPSEGLDYYLKEFDGFENIFVDRKGNVVNWLFSAEAVIHCDCTTGIEAFLAEKPVISYSPNHDDDLAAELPILMSDYSFDREEEVKNFVQEIFSRSYQGTDRSERLKILREHLLMYGDDCNSSDVIVQKVLERQVKATRKKLSFSIIIKRIKSVLKDIIMPKNSMSGYRDRFPGISIDEVRNSIMKFEKINGDIGKYGCSKKGSDIVRIHLK
jgi:surface carbohydrate biosynthesis protein